MKYRILLSFDVEEFDFPRERGENISLEEGVKISETGLKKIMTMLKRRSVKATFFCTGNFAKLKPELLEKIIKNGHEVACHGVDHFNPKKSDICESKKMIEKIIKQKVYGYRQPRMQKIDYKELKKCGYNYDSSVNPAFIPGRYNNLRMPKKPFKRLGIWEIPVSVTTKVRMPMFWLAFHLFPFGVYYKLVWKILKKEGYFATYFHPWEFADLKRFKIVPWYIMKNSGDELVKRLEKLIKKLQGEECEFVTYGRFVKSKRAGE